MSQDERCTAAYPEPFHDFKYCLLSILTLNDEDREAWVERREQWLRAQLPAATREQPRVAPEPVPAHLRRAEAGEQPQAAPEPVPAHPSSAAAASGEQQHFCQLAACAAGCTKEAWLQHIHYHGLARIRDKLANRTPSYFTSFREQKTYAMELMAWLAWQGEPLPHVPSEHQRRRQHSKHKQERAQAQVSM